MSNDHSFLADILYGSYIRYERMYAMTKFALFGADQEKYAFSNINIFIDLHSILKSVYSRGSNYQVDNSYAMASCLINLAIHLRAYFGTRHNMATKVYLIYGGARPQHVLNYMQQYNNRNIVMEDSNEILKILVADNLRVVGMLCPYLYDMFYIQDDSAEFDWIASSIIDRNQKNNDYNLNLIYSRDVMAYQMVAFKKRTFMFRPKKSMYDDISWVVTKSTIYNAYRYAELQIKKQFDTALDPKLFSLFLSIAGLKTRNIQSLINANSTIKILDAMVQSMKLINGYNQSQEQIRMALASDTILNPDIVLQRYNAIDLMINSNIYQSSPQSIDIISSGEINLYNPDDVREINNMYFQKYPLDLNRV